MIGYGCSGAVLLVATVLVGLAVDSSMIPLFAFCSYFSLLVVMAYAEAGDISPFLQSVVEHALLGFALVLNFFLIWALIQVMGHMTIHFAIEEMHRKGGNIRLQSSDRGMYVHGTRADMGRYNRLGM
eukprot:643322-Rhodomonas_salina.1